MAFKFFKNFFLKTRSFLGDKLKSIFSKPLDEETLEELEEALYTADLGSVTTLKLVEEVRQTLKRSEKPSPEELIEKIKNVLKQDLQKHISKIDLSKTPTVILVVGVNGNGKTTSCAKLANHLKKQGKKVLVAAADTFRAAAVDQLELWSKRLDFELIKAQIGSDPAAVAFDGLAAALSRQADVLLIDTAGRLETKSHLMQELEKISRVLKKQVDKAPHETLLVVDATIGQNAIEQAKIFNKHTPLSGIILTKLDGSAKGGVVISIEQELNIPIKFIGVGESEDDFKAFDPNVFVDELFH